MRLITLNISTVDEKNAQALFNDLFQDSKKYSSTGECNVTLSSFTDQSDVDELVLHDPTLEKVREIMRQIGGLTDDAIGEILYALLLNNIVCKTVEVNQ